MLRVTRIEESGKIVLRLEGKLVGPWVTELADVCSEAKNSLIQPQTIDLNEVTFADVDGLSLLRRLRNCGYRLQNCQPLLKEELKF